MGRFQDEDFEEYKDWTGDESEENSEEDEDAIQVENYDFELRLQELHLTQKQLNLEIMDKAIKIAHSGWFWWFFSFKTRLERIYWAYASLTNLMESEIIKEEE